MPSDTSYEGIDERGRYAVWQPIKRLMYDTGSSRTLIEFPDGWREWMLPGGIRKVTK